MILSRVDREILSHVEGQPFDALLRKLGWLTRSEVQSRLSKMVDAGLVRVDDGYLLNTPAGLKALDEGVAA